MVVDLEAAVSKRREALGASFTRADLLAAIKDGARLRLRPKVMTVSTIVAGLLPIMWSARTGAEVMKPLATPVLGGMVSSLLHVLIVTPSFSLGYGSEKSVMGLKKTENDCPTAKRDERHQHCL